MMVSFLNNCEKYRVRKKSHPMNICPEASGLAGPDFGPLDQGLRAVVRIGSVIGAMNGGNEAGVLRLYIVRGLCVNRKSECWLKERRYRRWGCWRFGSYTSRRRKRIAGEKERGQFHEQL
jgi:hypothetical protein